MIVFFNPAPTVVNADDIAEAQRQLSDVLTEVNKRNAYCADTGRREWPGPKLHLTINDLSQVVNDPTCRYLLARILRTGRKAGVIGQAHDNNCGLRDRIPGGPEIADMLANGGCCGTSTRTSRHD